MKKVAYQSIKNLIPEDCWYKQQDYQCDIIFFDGDQQWDKPLDLDDAYAVDETDDFYPFIVVKGNLKASQLFNAETDGSTGLIVLGNLDVDNMVVGGQEIFVTGNLTVKDLFWGDYNHGSLLVKGSIRARVFINTDYGVDHQRFQSEDNIHIAHLLWDDADDDFSDIEYLQQLFRPEFLLTPDELDDDDIWSWKCWLNTTAIFTALAQSSPLLLDTIETPDNTPPAIPFFFNDEALSEENLRRFAQSKLLTGWAPDAGDELYIQYWSGSVYKRVFMIHGQPDSILAYFQAGESFACMVYLAEQKSLYGALTGKKKYVLSTAFKVIEDGDNDNWQPIDGNTEQSYRDFLLENWPILLREYSEMISLQAAFFSQVSREKFEEIMNLPLAQYHGKKYYSDDDDASLYIRGAQWQFRVENKEEEQCARISLVQQLADDEDGEEVYDFYHIDLEEAMDGSLKPILYTQDTDGYDAEVYEVPACDLPKFRKALKYFSVLEKNIFKMNQHFWERQ